MKQSIIKYIRDGVKSKYKYGTECAICKDTNNLEFHHLYTIYFLLQEYTKHTPIDEENLLEFREQFINHYYKELVEDTVTLCEKHHTLLHKIYGSKPPLHTASKQELWILKQHNKIFNPESTPKSGLSKFKV